MKLFVIGVCFFLVGFKAAQALRCMQAFVNNISPQDPEELKILPEFVECEFTNVGISAMALLALKPNTATFPSTDYKCFNLRFEETQSKNVTVMKGCIYKAQNVCDGKFQQDTVQEVFCSQCDQDECNSALRFASNWKILSLTISTIVCFFMK